MNDEPKLTDEEEKVFFDLIDDKGKKSVVTEEVHKLFEIDRSLSIDPTLTIEEKEKKVRDFIHSYTLGIEPHHLFHIDYDLIIYNNFKIEEHDFDINDIQVVHKLPNGYIKNNLRENKEIWTLYLNNLKSDQLQALNRFESWVEFYSQFRTQASIFNNLIVNEKRVYKIERKVLGWIEKKRLEFKPKERIEIDKIEGYYNELGLRYYKLFNYVVKEDSIKPSQRLSATRICEKHFLIDGDKIDEKKRNSILRYINRYQDKDSPFKSKLHKLK